MSYEDAPLFSDGPRKTADYIRRTVLAGREGETVHGIVAYTPDMRIVAIEEVVAKDTDDFQLFETIERLARDNNSRNVLMFVQHPDDDPEPCMADAEMLDIASDHFERRGIDVMVCLGISSDDSRFAIPESSRERLGLGGSEEDFLKRKASEARELIERFRGAALDKDQLAAMTQETYEDILGVMETIAAHLERSEMPPRETIERSLELVDLAQSRLTAAGYAPMGFGEGALQGPNGPEQVIGRKEINLGFVDEMPEDVKQALLKLGIPEEMLNPQPGKRLGMQPRLQRGPQQASAAEPFGLPDINPPKKRPLGRPYDYD